MSSGGSSRWTTSGTGYSSLAYLRHFPVNALEIDREFLADLEHDATTVRTVLSAAAALGPEVVAEGVESTRQRDILRGVGCDNAQGYLLAQPLSARDLGRLLAVDRQGAGLGLRTRNPRGCPTVSPT